MPPAASRGEHVEPVHGGRLHLHRRVSLSEWALPQGGRRGR